MSTSIHFYLSLSNSLSSNFDDKNKKQNTMLDRCFNFIFYPKIKELYLQYNHLNFNFNSILRFNSIYSLIHRNIYGFFFHNFLSQVLSELQANSVSVFEFLEN